MNLAVIPLVVWWIASVLLAGGAGVAGHKMYVDWEKGKGPAPVVIDGVCMVFDEPMRCVDKYYESVTTAKYEQYQYCVMEPMDIDEFNSKAGKLCDEMNKKGRKPELQPVRGRHKDPVKDGNYEGMIVVAVSPWSGKEEKYVVVKHGSSWKIVKEK